MRQLPAAYSDVILSNSHEPVFVAKILNATNTIYVTTRPITINDVGSIQLHGIIEGASFASQEIKPEDAVSKIGSMSIAITDKERAFTNELNAINNLSDSLYNDKVELYVGDARIDFADYLLWTPLYVEDFSNDDLSYSLRLSDTQRITKKSLFADLAVTELVGSYGRSDASSIEVVNPEGFPLVQHDSDWAEDPNETIGYLKAYGISRDGREIKEVISYTGTTATHFTGVKRARFGTERIDLSAVDSQDNAVTVELHEMVYLDLVQPKMLYALLTGDLYGQVGQTLPTKWHAGLSSSLISLQSVEDIGGDLWQEHIEFRDLDDDDAKGFIAEQVLSPYGTFLRIDQQGEYNLSRYDYVSLSAPTSKFLSYDELYSVSEVKRSVKDVVNFFRFNWEWRVDADYYARNDIYVDANSQSKYDYDSPLKDINLRGLRNRSLTSKPSLDFVVQSQVKRLSNAKVTRTATARIWSVAELEVGDTVTLLLPNEPDFETLNDYEETFEIQSMNVDFLSGTATMKLFASDGEPSEFISENGDDVVNIGHVGWTDLAGTAYGTHDGTTFTFINGVTIPNGKYFYNGNVQIPTGATIAAVNSFYLDCASFSMAANSKIDMKGRGVVGGAGYFGLGNTAQGALQTEDPGIFKVDRIWYRGGQNFLANGKTIVDLPSVLRIQDGQQIDSLIPQKLYGHGGPKGGDSILNGMGTITGSTIGGAPVAGGGGFFCSCNSFIYASSAVIDVSGNDGNQGGRARATVPITGVPQFFNAGSSGFGQSGVVVFAMKDRSQPKPLLDDVVVANNGLFNELALTGSDLRIINGSSAKYKRDGTARDYYARLPDGHRLSGKNNSLSSNSGAIRVISLITAGAHVPERGVDDIGTAQPVSLSLTPKINVPRTPLGNQITIEITAIPDPSDNQFRYALFEYKLQGQQQWVPIAYDVTTEATVTVTASGDTYDIRATSYNSAGQSGGVTETQYTAPLIDRNPEETQAPDLSDDVKVPEIKGLELVNRINDQDGWNQWKSPNAEFQWKRSSFTAQSSISNLNGYVDLHLEGYLIRVYKQTGELLREELIKENSYIYTYDKNKKDTNGAPVRQIRFQVQAVSNTGHASAFNKIEVSNPAPSAPANVTFDADYKSITASYDLPEDIDFIGVDTFIITGTGDPYAAEPVRKQGNQVVWQGLDNGQTYTIGLRSVDQFGNGGQITAVGVTVDKIPSTDLADIDSTVNISANGLVVTDNGGFVAFHGAINAPSESVNPLIFGAYDGVNFPFWINSDGDFKFGLGDNSISFNGSSLEFGAGVSIGSAIDRTYTVGPSGDYLDLNTALEALSKTIPAYKNGGVSAKIVLQSGYTMTESIHVDGIDLGWIDIETDTGVTIPVDVDVNMNYDANRNAYCKIYATNQAVLPNFINCMFDISGRFVATNSTREPLILAASGSRSIVRGGSYNRTLPTPTKVPHMFISTEGGSIFVDGLTLTGAANARGSETDRQGSMILRDVTGVSSVSASRNSELELYNADSTEVVSIGLSRVVSIFSALGSLAVSSGGQIELTSSTYTSANVPVNTFTSNGTIFV